LMTDRCTGLTTGDCTRLMTGRGSLVSSFGFLSSLQDFIL